VVPYPAGSGLLHPPHEADHEPGCGLTQLGLIPLWHPVQVPRSALEHCRRCQEPDFAVIAALRYGADGGRTGVPSR
jgi:hypothetical protein